MNFVQITRIEVGRVQAQGPGLGLAQGPGLGLAQGLAECRPKGSTARPNPGLRRARRVGVRVKGRVRDRVTVRVRVQARVRKL